MVDLSLDLSNPLSSTFGDLLVIDGDLVLTSDADPRGTNPILQDIVQSIRFFLAEWFLDNTQGLPWFQQILVKNPNQSAIDAIFKNVILGRPGVLQLASYSFDSNFTNRTLNVSFSAVTTSGTVNYNGTLTPVGGGTTQ